MIEVQFFINDKRINPPTNHEETSVEVRFDTDAQDFKGQISTNSWTFDGGDKNDPKDPITIINKHVEGTIGVGQDIRFDIKIKDGVGGVQDFLIGSLDLFAAEYSCSTIKANSMERGGIDWFNRRADSFGFGYLAEGIPFNADGFIGRSDYLDVPYTLSDKPEEAFVAILSAFVITRELIQSFKEFQEFSISFTNDYLSFGNLVALIFILVQNILLLLALILLMKQIGELIIKPLKYSAGMYVRTLCEKASEYMGLEFQSSILYNTEFHNIAIVPESYQQFLEPSFNWGNVLKDTIGARVGVFDARSSDRKGHYNGTFGDLLRNLKTMFNAKLIVGDGKLLFERDDYVSSTDSYRIPNLDLSNNLYKFNSEDYNTYFRLSFTPDLNDKNVWQDYLGTEVEVLTTLKTKALIDGTIHGGNSVEKVIDFSLGRAKKELSWIDKFFLTLITNVIAKLTNKIKRKINRQIAIANSINPIARIIKKLNFLGFNIEAPSGTFIPPINYPNLAVGLTTNILSKLKYLRMEEDYINVPKVILFNQPEKPADPKFLRVSDDNDKYINAKYLYNKFYDSSSFAVKGGGKHNQHKVHSISNVPFCLKDFNKVKNNSVILSPDGITKANIISLKWNIYKQTADITYKVKTLFSDNFVEQIIESDGR